MFVGVTYPFTAMTFKLLFVALYPATISFFSIKTLQTSSEDNSLWKTNKLKIQSLILKSDVVNSGNKSRFLQF